MFKTQSWTGKVIGLEMLYSTFTVQYIYSTCLSRTIVIAMQTDVPQTCLYTVIYWKRYLCGKYLPSSFHFCESGCIIATLFASITHSHFNFHHLVLSLEQWPPASIQRFSNNSKGLRKRIHIFNTFPIIPGQRTHILYMCDWQSVLKTKSTVYLACVSVFNIHFSANETF